MYYRHGIMAQYMHYFIVLVTLVRSRHQNYLLRFSQHKQYKIHPSPKFKYGFWMKVRKLPKYKDEIKKKVENESY